MASTRTSIFVHGETVIHFRFTDVYDTYLFFILPFYAIVAVTKYEQMIRVGKPRDCDVQPVNGREYTTAVRIVDSVLRDLMYRQRR